MQKILLALTVGCIFSFNAFAQTPVYHENFELPSLGDSVSWVSITTNSWSINTAYFAQGARSMHCVVMQNDTTELITNAFSTVGQSFVLLQFAHICKIDYFDNAEVFYSINNGVSWTKISAAHYLGTGVFSAIGDRFTSTSYVDWQAANNAALPTNAWWRSEQFNISTLVGSQASVRIKFRLSDGGGNGSQGAYGWLIDDIRVLTSPNELIPPQIVMSSGNPADTAYNTGPFNVSATITDASGISWARLIYTVDSGSPDTLAMTAGTGGVYSAQIPAQVFQSVVCYRVEAADIHNNIAVNPLNGCLSFHVKEPPNFVIIGTATTANSSVLFYNSGVTSGYRYGDYIAIYTPQEVNAGGPINAVSFFKANNLAYLQNNATVRIYIKHTNLTAVPTTSGSLTAQIPGSTLVYENTAFGFPASSGWLDFWFNQANFNYNGTDNLMIMVYYYHPDGCDAITWRYSVAAGMAYTWAQSTYPPTAGYGNGNRANIKIGFAPQNLNYDAGISAITEPVGNVVAPTAIPVRVKVKNYGNQALTKAMVHWSVDGVNQSPVLWTGNLLKDIESTPFQLATMSFALGHHSIKAWTVNPNDSIDQYAYNDTSVVQTYICNSMLSGTYTIGGSSPDFTTFSSALTALHNCGISGPVVFRIASGIYSERLELFPVSGASSTNTITFESFTGNNSDVVIQYAATGAADNFVVRFNGISNVIFRNVTLKAQGAANGRVIDVASNSSYLLIEGNVIETLPSTGSAFAGVYSTSAAPNTDVTIKNNVFRFGYYGIYWYGSSVNPKNRFVLESNIFENFYYYGFFGYYTDSLIIRKNSFTNSLSSATNYQVYISNNQNYAVIEKNKVNIRATATNSSYGISLLTMTNSVANSVLVANNFVSQSGSTGTCYGIYLSNASNTNVVYNSVNITGGSATGGRALFQSGGTANTFVNNSFSNTGGGYAYYISTPTSVTQSNYNNYYTTGTNMAYWSTNFSSLAALQTANFMDGNSKSVDPSYLSLADLHSTSPVLWQGGTPVSFVADDIDDQPRNSTTPCIGADEFMLTSNDAGVLSLAGNLCSGTYPVNIVLKNYGLNALTGVIINWSYNGVLQTPYSFSGSVAPNGSTTLLLGSVTVPSNSPVSILAWTTLPNNLPDQNTANDTLNLTNVYASLSGVVTIGSGADFSNFSSAVSALHSRGLCGPVDFQVLPGTYNEQIAISVIPNVSAINTVTFKSQNGVKSSVVLQYSATSTADNFVVKLELAKYIRFRDMTIRAGGATNGRAVELMNDASFNEFTGCNIESSIGTSSTLCPVYSASSTASNYNLFEGNVIKGGYYGVYWYGSSSTTTRKKGTAFINNTIQDYYYYGMYSYYTDSAIVRGNRFMNSSSAGSCYHLYFYYNQNHGYIEKNTVLMSNTSTAYGITVSNNSGSAATPVRIANNFVAQVSGTTTCYAIYLASITNLVQVYYNSVNVVSTSTGGRALFHTGGAGHVHLLNNILHNSGSGYAFYTATDSTIKVSNYNNFYTNGTNLIYWAGANQTTLAAYQSLSGLDANSKNLPVVFFSNSDLHTFSTSVYQAGTPILGISDDIDGQPRHALTPCIGADEFLLVANDAAAVLLVEPSPACAGTNTVKVRVRNFGTATLTSFSVGWEANGVAQTSVNYTMSIPQFSTADVILGTVSVTPGIALDIKAWTFNPNGVADQNTFNDTLLVTGIGSGPFGNYTIGGGPGNDFPSFNAALSFISQGICGPVVFSVANGVYTEQLDIPEIPGTSALNTITFKSASNDSNAVILQFAPNSSATPFVVRFNGADYIRFYRMTIRSTSTSYGRIVEFSTGADYNELIGNIIECMPSTSSNHCPIYSTSNTPSSYAVIKQNILRNGYYGVYWYGTASLVKKGLLLDSNIIEGYHYYGLYLYYSDSTFVRANIFSNASSSTTCYHIYNYFQQRYGDISANKIKGTNTGTFYGIALLSPALLSPMLISNNFISHENGTGTTYGLYMSSANSVNVYHNSINITCGTAANSRAFFTSGGSMLNIRNNIFSNTAGGYATYIGTPSAVFAADFNNYYAPGGLFAYWNSAQSGLLHLQTVSGQEVNSVSMDPFFVSSSDLHALNPVMKGLATPIAQVPRDIDGELRDVTNPDMGADEFVPLAREVSLNRIDLQTVYCDLDSIPVSIVFRNNGTDTITTGLSAGFRIIGRPQLVSESLQLTIFPSDSAIYTFNQKADISTTVDAQLNVQAWVSLTGDIYKPNDTLVFQIVSGIRPTPPTASPATISYGNTATLNASSPHTIFWFADPVSVMPLAVGPALTTPVLFDTSLFYVEARVVTGNCPSIRIPVTVNVINIPQVDIGVAEILTQSGCGLTSSDDVSLRVYNLGTGTAASGSYTARFRVNNQPWSAPEMVNLSIGSKSDIVYTFAAKANLLASNDTFFILSAMVSHSTDPYHPNDTLYGDTVVSLYTPVAPQISSPVNIPYGTTASLSAVSVDTLKWYASDTATTELWQGAVYLTPPLFDTTTFWVQAHAGSQVDFSLNTGPHVSIYTASQARGYHFTAPVNMTITELMVPLIVGAGVQNIQVVKFSGVPTTYGNPGTPFTTLYYTNSAPNGVPVNVNIPISAGDEIAVIGGAGTSTIAMSYGGSLVPTTINGIPVTLTRIVYQSNLNSGAATSGNLNTELAAAIGRIEMKYEISTSNGCASALVPVVVQTGAVPGFDIGAFQILNPPASVTSGVNVPLTVTIRNFGTTAITSATIHYSINGVPRTPYQWTGSAIAQNSLSQPLIIGNELFGGGSYDIAVWTSLPNGQPDPVAANDTVKLTVIACLSGNYTVGGAGSDFLTFDDAYNALYQAGVCGHVVFELAPMVVNAQYNFTPVPGAGPNATVTFRSVSSDSTTVVIQYNSQTTGDNFVIRFAGGKYIRLEHLTLKALGTTYGRVVEFLTESHNNILSGNLITCQANTSSNFAGIYSTSNALVENTLIEGNRIENGYYGIYWYSTSTMRKKNTILQNNHFDGFYYYGAYFYYTDSLVFRGNKMINSTTSTSAIHVYSYYHQNNAFFEKNQLIGDVSGTFYGVGVLSNSNISGTSVLIANNFISHSGSTGTVYGIFLSTAFNVNVYHNSLNINGGTATAGRGIHQSGGGNINLINNIISNPAGGYTYYISTPTAITNSNFNNLYGTGINLAYYGANYANLNALRSGTGKEMNSLSLNPFFVSQNDLHTFNIDLDGKGIALSSVPDDIDGDLRSTTAPDIGADEFIPPQNDAGVVALNTPSSPVILGLQPVRVRIKNYGINPLTSVSIGWSVNGLSQGVYSWTGNLATGSTLDSVLIGNYTFVAGSADLKIWTFNPNQVADLYNYNDTFNANLVACASLLKGTYTIGGPGADYSTFTAAVNALAHCGIDSSVVFVVSPGTYNEQINFTAISGASVTNTVRFTSANSDSSSVILSFGSQGLNNNYVVRFMDVSWVSLEKITIQANNSTYAYVVVIDGSSSNIDIRNCRIISAAGSSSTTAGIYNPNLTNQGYIRVLNSLIMNGYYGVYLYGTSSSSREYNNEISGNHFQDFFYYGIYTYNQDSLSIHNNRFVSTSQFYPRAITCYYTYSGVQISGNYIQLAGSSYSYGIYIYYAYANANRKALIANNHIVNATGSGTDYGLYLGYSTNANVVYNSMHIYGSNSNSRVLYGVGGSANNLINNNIVNSAGGMAYYISTAAVIDTTDYNNLYTSGANLAYFSSNASNLANLQTLTGKETNSVSVDPGFYSNTDLRVTSPALNASALTLGYVTTDITGAQRDPLVPDIGAFEFSPLGTDAAAVALVVPTTSFGPVGQSLFFDLRIRNYGTSPLTSVPVGYKAGNNAPVTATWTGNLAPGMTADYTFTVPYAVVVGQQVIKLFTALAGDLDSSNDTLVLNYMGVPVVAVPYSDNFDAGTTYWSGAGVHNHWERGVPSGSVINSSFSPPNAWATVLNAQYSPNADEYLYSPYFNFSSISGATLKFRHWYNTQSGADGCRVQYSSNQGASWSTLGYVSDPAGTLWYTTNVAGTHCWTGNSSGWIQSTFDLSAFNNETNPVQFRFHFFSNASTQNDGWAVDNFEIVLPQIATDGGVSSIVLPPDSTIKNSVVQVQVRITNYGSQALTSVPVKYQVNSLTPVSGLWTGNLNTNDSVLYTFATTYLSPVSDYNLKAWTEISGDLYATNDATQKAIRSVSAPFDAGVYQVITPTDTTYNLASRQPVVLVRNYGSSAITGIEMQYSMNGFVQATETWTGTLPPGDSLIYTFTTAYTPFWMYQFCARTLLANDADTSNDKTCKYVVPSGLEDFWVNGLQLWQNQPNPAGQTTTILFKVPVPGPAVLEVYNLTGQMVYKEERVVTSGEQRIELSLESMPAGVYTYGIVFDGQRLTRRMVVVK